MNNPINFKSFILETDKIEDILDSNQLSLFFKKGSDYFGAPEDSRIIFAKLKNNDEDEPLMPGFKDQARFLALNLIQTMLRGDSAETLFGSKDIPQICIIDREDAVKNMLKNSKKKK